LEEVLKLTRAKWGPEHPETLVCMDALARAYLDDKKVEQALSLHEEAFRLMKARLGPEHPETLSIMSALAHTYGEAGKVDRAVSLSEEVLRLRRAALGREHTVTFKDMNNLAYLYQKAGRLDQAIPLLEEALPKLRSRLGPEHPDTLTCLDNLACAYRDDGKVEQAIPLFDEELKLRTATSGPDHPRTLRSMNNLGVACWTAGRLDRSMPLFEELLKRHTATLGPDHPDTLAKQADLGLNYADAGRLPDAIRLLEEALARARKGPHPLPDGLAWILRVLAETYDRAGLFAQADPLFRQHLAEVKARYGADHPETASGFNSLGYHLLRAGQPAEAEAALRECLAIREKKGPDAWTTFNTKSVLGGALLGQRKYAEAEPLLRQGYDGMKQWEAKIPPMARKRLTEAADRLAELYDATGRPDQAKAVRAKAPASPAQRDP
jgi:tetratricopeptide (TPR) repeat protein